MRNYDPVSKQWVRDGEPTPFTPSKLAPVLKLDLWAHLAMRHENALDRFYPNPTPASYRKLYRYDMVCVDGKGWIPVGS